MTKRRTLRLAECAWCGERKPLDLMRHPSSSRGKTPSTCHACREANPDLSWCDFHGEPHERSKFTPNSRPIGVRNICVAASSKLQSRARKTAPIPCVSCGDEQESWEFRGGNNKSPTCRDCEQTNEGKRWCYDCKDWLDESRFNRTGVGGKFWTIRCKPCRSAHNHGTTVAEILRMQGSSRPECAACGDTERLVVDHDHGCCPAEQSCGDCIRGYLCRSCNRAEGLLGGDPRRARGLADYMERNGVASVSTV